MKDILIVILVSALVAAMFTVSVWQAEKIKEQEKMIYDLLHPCTYLIGQGTFEVPPIVAEQKCIVRGEGIATTTIIWPKREV